MADAIPPFDPTIHVNLVGLALLLVLTSALVVSAIINNRSEWPKGKRLAPLLRVLALGMLLLMLATERGNYQLASLADPLNDEAVQLKLGLLQAYRLPTIMLILWTFPLIAAILAFADLKNLLGKGSIPVLVVEILTLAALVIGDLSGFWMHIVSAHVN